MMRLLPLIFSAILTLVAGHLLIRKAFAWGLIDTPNSRKVHTLPTPRTGGMAMVLGGGLAFVLSSVIGLIQWPNLPWQTWLAGFGFIFVGALDDHFSFYPRQKFLVLLSLSALAAWPWMASLKITDSSWLPHTWTNSFIFLPISFGVITFWFMAVPNAVNIEDAINGYMGGFTFIVMLSLIFSGINTSIALGALLGFLSLNWPKAKHFMGDTGSFGCGFFIAEAILQQGGLNDPMMALALTAPISLDVAMGLIRRHQLGMSFFSEDRSTIPHRTLNLFDGNIYLTTILLWLNAAVFAFLYNFKYFLLYYTFIYIIILIFLNRHQLCKNIDKS